MRISSFVFVMLLMMGVVVSCDCIDNSRNVMPVNMDTYLNDKKNISKFYIENVEYYRLYARYGRDTIGDAEHFRKYPYAASDPANFFEPYANRMISNKNKYSYIFINSPLPTSSQINVSVDTIIYNKTGELFVAFVCIENKYSKIRGLCDERHCFDGKAMIGFRDSVDNSIKVYPLTNFETIGMDSKKLAIFFTRFDYMVNLKGSSIAGSVFGTNRFKENVGDKDFFENSQFFKKDKFSHYYFQLYNDIDGTKIYKYPYGT